MESSLDSRFHGNDMEGLTELWKHSALPLLPQIAAEGLRAAGVTKTANGFFFDLANALAGELEFLADLFER